MEWNVYYFDINHKKIEKFNIFDHWNFREEVKKAVKKWTDKDVFAAELRSILMYYFWSRFQWELIIEIKDDNRVLLTPFGYLCNTEGAIIDVTNENNFDWNGFAEKHINEQVYKNIAKIDVYSQVDYVWNDFVEYCWNYRHEIEEL